MKGEQREMKRIVVLLLVFALILVFTSCGTVADTQEDTAEITDEAAVINDEADWVVDEEAFKKYGDKAKESAEACFESSKDDLGLTDIKLVHFEKIWEDKDEDGSDLLLYSWEYSVGVNDPDSFMLAAGMHFDSEMRVRTFNGFWGELAIKEKNEEIINTALIVYDEMVWPEYAETEEDKQFIKDRVTEKLS